MSDSKPDIRSLQSGTAGEMHVGQGDQKPPSPSISDGRAAPARPSAASDEELILAALADRRFRTRTVGGIAAQTQLGEDRVRALIRESPVLSQEVKLFPFRSTEGKVLLTTRERFDETSTFAERFVDAFASKRGDLDAT